MGDRSQLDELIAQGREAAAREEEAKARAGSEHVKLLDAGVKAWLASAKLKWLRAGGYGFPLTQAEVEEIRAAGHAPAPLDPWGEELLTRRLAAGEECPIPANSRRAGFA